MGYFREKIRALLISRRFQAAVIGLVLVVLQDLFGLSEDQVQLILQLIMAWIVGDSINMTTSPRLERLRGSHASRSSS